MQKNSFQLLILGLFFSMPLCAQPDPLQPVYISADTAEMDEKAGVSTYTGNVRIEQSGLEVAADKIIVHFSGGQIQQLNAVGSPVSYTETKGAGSSLYAHSDKLEYMLDEGRVVLSGRAEVTRDGNFMRGDSIVYRLNEQSVRINSGRRQRVETLLQPVSRVIQNNINNKDE